MRDNIFYIKIFQGICNNTNIFNKIQSEYLKKFLDNVPFNNSELYDDYETVKNIEVDKDIERILRMFVMNLVFDVEIDVKGIASSIEYKPYVNLIMYVYFKYVRK